MQTPGIELEGPYKSTSIEGGDGWWYGGGSGAWSSLSEALSKIPTGKRLGLTIGVISSGKVVEYWWPEDGKFSDSDIKEKSTQSIAPGSVYTTDQADQKFYNKTQSDERYVSPEVLKESYISKIQYDVNRSEDLMNTNLIKEDLDKKSSKEDLATQVSAVLTEIDNKFSSVLRNWVDPIEFVYDGVNNVFETSFEAIEPDISFLFYDNQNVPLNPLYDYLHSGKTIKFRNGVLVPGKKYFLLLKYLK